MNKNGFTLIEILTTVIILVIGIVAVNQALVRCVGAVRYAEDKLYASFLLEKKAAEIQMTPVAVQANGTAGFLDADSLSKEEAGPFKVTVKERPVMRDERSLIESEISVKGPSGAAVKGSVIRVAPEVESKG